MLLLMVIIFSGILFNCKKEELVSDNNGQSCSELGGMAFDPTNKRLYIIEKSLPIYNADDQAVVHVWSVN